MFHDVNIIFCFARYFKRFDLLHSECQQHDECADDKNTMLHSHRPSVDVILALFLISVSPLPNSFTADKTLLSFAFKSDILYRRQLTTDAVGGTEDQETDKRGL